MALTPGILNAIQFMPATPTGGVAGQTRFLAGRVELALLDGVDDAVAHGQGVEAEAEALLAASA